MTTEQNEYWVVRASIEFLPGHTANGITLSPCLPQDRADQVLKHLEEKYNIQGKVIRIKDI